jgi:hypothetical protein
MLETDALESAILQELARVDNCTPDELALLLPDYSWTQVFVAVDRLAREGTVALDHPGPFLCFISLARD